MDLVGRQHMAGDRVDQRAQRKGRLADPAGQRRAAEIDPAAGEDLGLAIERQVRAILVDQQMGEQPGTRPTTVDRQVRRGRLLDRLTGSARHLRPDVPDHLEVPRHVLQDLAAVLAQRPQRAAAGRARHGRGVDHRLVRQMVGKRAPGRLDPGSRSRRRSHGHWRLASRRFAAFQLLQRQLELRDLARQLLRRAAELHPPQPPQLHLQLLDLQRLALQRCERRRHQLLQAGDIVRQGVEIDHRTRLR